VKQKRFPLHIHIATLFILLTLAFGLAMGWFNYKNNAQILLSASRQAFEQINQELISDLHAKHLQTTGSINLLIHTPLVHAGNLSQRLKQLSLLTTVLQDNHALSALQIGYANGDYFIVRPLNDAYMRKRFQAPDKAVYVVENIRGGKGRHPMQRLYLDAALQELSRRELPPSSYDPRLRDWYRLALRSSGAVESKPYLYFFIRKVGITIGRKAADATAVVAADISLESLSGILARHPVSPSAEILVVDGDKRVVAYPKPDRIVLPGENDTVRLAFMEQMGGEVLGRVATLFSRGEQDLDFEQDDRHWMGTIRKLTALEGSPLYLVIVAPDEELLAEAYRINRRNALITLVIFLITLPAVWYSAHRITHSLRVLAAETEVIRDLDFSQPVTTKSHVLEIADLAQGMKLMKETINKFLRLLTSLSEEQDFDQMLQLICRETLDASHARGAGILMLDEEGRHLLPALWQVGDESRNTLLHLKISADPGQGGLMARVRDEGNARFLVVDNAGKDAFLQAILDDLQCSGAELGIFPLKHRRGHISGLLYLVYPETELDVDGSSRRRRQGFLKELSGFAAVSLETRKLLKSQKDLLQAFIQLIAGAIDAKSPYTGGHCQRVPELTRMLAEAASSSEEEPFASFNPGADDWEAIHIASWLHDCGKITTPEYVVDKATKLETIYNRIHEIRTRFEVLKRDAEIACWQAISGGGNREECLETLQQELQKLDDDYSFVARCNEGGEFLAEEDRQRLESIAHTTWLRTLDDGIGLSREELQRRKSTRCAEDLPVEESLLADREADRIPLERDPLPAAGRSGKFHMDRPECRFDLGEMHNLVVERGTLTPEERYIINEHIIQTILMLEQLPWPKHLQKVPDIAGGHHEKMDGTGYPRRLTREELPLEARIMAIADIFEALTASDRPYKAPKKLSEALKIMYFMKQDQHIDADLFDLFLRAGVYRKYAEKHLSPEQRDEVDIREYLS
jgi:HD-GYP domain-containing protein (c-di-GMP phosphodiesterase class II)